MKSLKFTGKDWTLAVNEHDAVLSLEHAGGVSSFQLPREVAQMLANWLDGTKCEKATALPGAVKLL